MRILGLSVTALLNYLIDLLGMFAQCILLSAFPLATVWAAASIYGPKVMASWNLLTARL